VILDTNAVSAILAADSQIENVLASAVRHHLPVVVIGEYVFGILGSSRQKKLQAAFERLALQSIVLPCTRATADQFASVRFELKRKGRPIPINDLWIAALARQHNLEIVSQDSHFDDVDGIQRIHW
jgi:predicted nucleic acid-binding protein